MSPILLSPGDRLVTVFGGGKVALRKCRHFEGFRIRVVSPEVLPELEAIADEVIRESVDPETAGGYMEGSDIVVAATHDHALNDAIRDVSMSKGIMTNSAHGGGDVLIPSTLHRDGYTVTVSSEGRVPAWLLAEGTEPDTLGLFLGPSMRDPDARLADEPPVVYLFLLNLWEYSEENEEVFAGEIERTLLHEFGHFLGLEEEEMPGRDLD